jgi:ribA/ribD-fused uncharacterized protein
MPKETILIKRDRFVFFWGGFLSNWHPSQFELDGTSYNCVEQWMMCEKARLFGDDDTLKLILNSDDPAKQKKLGRKVSGFDPNVWAFAARNRVYWGLVEKFRQNSDLLEELLETHGKFIVEASPYDTIWGIGLAADHPDVTDPEKWKGKNWLGHLLMKVRKSLNYDKVNEETRSILTREQFIGGFHVFEETVRRAEFEKFRSLI